MCELLKRLKRSNLESIVSYLISEVGENGELYQNYDEEVEHSYEELFTGIEKLYPQATRKDNRLFNILAEFTAIHDSIYFEAGLLIGFHIYGEFEDTYTRHSKNDFTALLQRLEKKKQVFPVVEKEDTDSLLEILAKQRMDTILEEVLRADSNYQKVNEQTQRKVKRIEKAGLTKAQWHIIDTALSACNERCSDYGRMAYMLGFKDGVKMFEELSE